MRPIRKPAKAVSLILGMFIGTWDSRAGRMIWTVSIALGFVIEASW